MAAPHRKLSSASTSSTSSLRHPPEFEPDDEWKTTMLATITESLNFMVKEADEDLQRKVKANPSNAQQYREDFKRTESAIKVLAKEEFQHALSKERMERRWAAGQALPADVSEALRSEQQIILDNIQAQKSASSGDVSNTQPEPPARASNSRSVPPPSDNIDEISEESSDSSDEESDDEEPISEPYKPPGGRYGPPPQSRSVPQRSTAPSPHEIWKPPISPEQDALAETPYMIGLSRRGSMNSMKSGSSVSFRQSAAHPPIPEFKEDGGEFAAKAEREKAQTQEAEQSWSMMNRAREKEAQGPRINTLNRLDDNTRTPSPMSSTGATSPPPIPPLATKPVVRRTSQASLLSSSRPPDSNIPSYSANRHSGSYHWDYSPVDQGSYEGPPGPLHDQRYPYYSPSSYEDRHPLSTSIRSTYRYEAESPRLSYPIPDRRRPPSGGTPYHDHGPDYYPHSAAEQRHFNYPDPFPGPYSASYYTDFRDIPRRGSVSDRRRTSDVPNSLEDVSWRQGMIDPSARPWPPNDDDDVPFNLDEEEEDIREKEEEEARKKEEARKEEETRRKEEEAKRKEEEARRKEEEARRKEEEELRLKEEEALRRKEEEIKRKEAEAKKKEEEIKRKEADARKKEAEVRKKEAEAKKKEAEARKKEEEAKKREQEIKRKEEQTRQREQEAALRAEETRRREEEIRAKEEELRKREEELRRKEQEMEERRKEEKRQHQEEAKRRTAETERQEREKAVMEEQKRLFEEIQRSRREEEEAARKKEADAKKQEDEQRRRDEEFKRAENDAAWNAYRQNKEQQEERRRKESERRRDMQDNFSPASPSSTFSSASSASSATSRSTASSSTSATSAGSRSAASPPSWTTWGTNQSSTSQTSASTRSSATPTSKPQTMPTPATPTSKPQTTPTPDPPPSSAEEWQRRQEELARKQQEKFRLEQERLERERLARAGTMLTKDDIIRLFDSHNRMWAALKTTSELRWDSFPWPTIKRPSAPEDITYAGVDAYVFSPYYPEKDSAKSDKDRVKEHIRKWHPDRFDTKWLPNVIKADQGLVKEGAGQVVRYLNDLLARKNSPGIFS